MRKLWVMAKHEYVKITRKRSFLFGTLAMPLFFVAITILTIVMVIATDDRRPIGYVDLAGVVTTVTQLPPEKNGPQPVELRAFPNEAQARAALNDKQIQAYYILPADYLTSHKGQLIYWDKAPSDSAQRDFDNLITRTFVTALYTAQAPTRDAS